MKKNIENVKERLILGITGSEVNCMLLDSKEDIKASNPHLTDEEVEKAFGVLQILIESTKEQDNEYIGEFTE